MATLSATVMATWILCPSCFLVYNKMNAGCFSQKFSRKKNIGLKIWRNKIKSLILQHNNINESSLKVLVA
jgi:hypothetical protein